MGAKIMKKYLKTYLPFASNELKRQLSYKGAFYLWILISMFSSFISYFLWMAIYGNSENGVIGREELDIIEPATKKLKKLGIDISLPISADSLMAKALRNYISKEKQPFDCYIAMYHDQGLIPIKAAGLDNVVNMTIGLDIIRTSPSHGTAFDIAGKTS